MSVTFNKSTCVESISVASLLGLVVSAYANDAPKTSGLLCKVYAQGLSDAIEKGDKDAYKKLKNELPAVLISMNSEKVASPKQFTALHQVQIDVDNLSKENVKRVFELFYTIPSVSLVFVSPSLNGVKAIVEYSPANCRDYFKTFESAKDAHKFAYAKCLAEVKSVCPDIIFDESCNNLNRLCFIPFSGEAARKVAIPVVIDFNEYISSGKVKSTRKVASGPELLFTGGDDSPYVRPLVTKKVKNTYSTKRMWDDGFVGPVTNSVEARSAFEQICKNIRYAKLGSIHDTVLKNACRAGYMHKEFTETADIIESLLFAFDQNEEAGGLTDVWERDIIRFVEFGMQKPKDTTYKHVENKFIEPTKTHEVAFHKDINTPELINANITDRSTHIVRGEHGVGKTSIIGKHVIGLSINNNNEQIATFLSPRVSLSSSIAKKFDIACYTDVRAAKSRQRKSIVITTNSIDNPMFREYLSGNFNLYIDEISTILKDIFNKNGTMKKNAGGIFKRLKEIIAGANVLVCSDADITDQVIDFISSVRTGPINYYDIKNNRQKPSVSFYKTKGTQHWAYVLDCLSSGEKVYCTSDSAADLSKLHCLIKKTYPEKKGLLIHSKNVTKEGAEFIKDAADSSGVTKLNYDYVLCSPSIESGVSIEYKHFDVVVAIYCGITSPTNFTQQMLRVRTVQHISLFNRETKGRGNKETIYETLLKRVTEANMLDEILGGGDPTSGCDEYTRYALKNLASENELMNSAHENLIKILEKRGYKLTAGDLKLKSVNKETVDVITAEIELKRQLDVLNAKDIDITSFEGLREYDRLKNIQFPEPSEFASIQRVKSKKILGCLPLNEETVPLTQNSNLVSQRLSFMARTADPRIINEDAMEREKNLPLHLRNNNRLFKLVFDYLDRTLGINSVTGTGSFCSADIKKIKLDADMAIAIDHLGLNISVNFLRTYETEMKYTVVSRIYKKIGIHFTGVSKNSKTTYTINMEPNLNKRGGVIVSGLDLMRKANG